MESVKVNKLLGMVCLGAVVVFGASPALATTWTYNPAPIPGHNDNAGNIESFYASYDDVTQILDLEFSLSEEDGKLANGYTLAISDGPNPKGNEHLALLYFDASEADPILTAYVYNGKNNHTSHLDGPTLISANDGPNGTDAISYTTNGNTATFGLTFDAGAINDNPAATGLADWLGIAFADHIGVWFHPFANLSTGYNNDGSLEYFHGQVGWLDFSNHQTTHTEVPEPATLSLLAAALCGGALRRRKEDEDEAAAA